jgi:hypothetical protein
MRLPTERASYFRHMSVPATVPSATVPSATVTPDAAARETAARETAAADLASCRRSPLGTFAECPQCGGDMRPEHAHYRCAGCGWRDSCCD